MNLPRCECHDCTQARAREPIGTLGGTVYSPPVSQQCPLCGQFYTGGHTCVRAAPVTHDGITHPI